MAGKVRILKERLFKVKKDDTKLLYVEGACDNDATPPQGNYVTGSAFENVTTGNKYKYSETSGDWVLQPSGGGGGGVLNLHMDRQTRALDKTWAEINAAFGSTIIFLTGTALLIGIEEDVAGYFVHFADFYDAPTVTKITFKADTADGYPVAQI